MSPSLVRERSSALEFYLKELCKQQELLDIPFVRIFLQLPMNQDQLKELEEGSVPSSKFNNAFVLLVDCITLTL
jgi:hypothetical protein